MTDGETPNGVPEETALQKELDRLELFRNRSGPIARQQQQRIREIEKLLAGHGQDKSTRRAKGLEEQVLRSNAEVLLATVKAMQPRRLVPRKGSDSIDWEKTFSDILSEQPEDVCHLQKLIGYLQTLDISEAMEQLGNAGADDTRRIYPGGKVDVAAARAAIAFSKGQLQLVHWVQQIAEYVHENILTDDVIQSTNRQRTIDLLRTVFVCVHGLCGRIGEKVCTGELSREQEDVLDDIKRSICMAILDHPDIRLASQGYMSDYFRHEEWRGCTVYRANKKMYPVIDPVRKILQSIHRTYPGLAGECLDSSQAIMRMAYALQGCPRRNVSLDQVRERVCRAPNTFYPREFILPMERMGVRWIRLTANQKMRSWVMTCGTETGNENQCCIDWEGGVQSTGVSSYYPPRNRPEDLRHMKTIRQVFAHLYDSDIAEIQRLYPDFFHEDEDRADDLGGLTFIRYGGDTHIICRFENVPYVGNVAPIQWSGIEAATAILQGAGLNPDSVLRRAMVGALQKTPKIYEGCFELSQVERQFTLGDRGASDRPERRPPPTQRHEHIQFSRLATLLDVLREKGLEANIARDKAPGDVFVLDEWEDIQRIPPRRHVVVTIPKLDMQVWVCNDRGRAMRVCYDIHDPQSHESADLSKSWKRRGAIAVEWNTKEEEQCKKVLDALITDRMEKPRRRIYPPAWQTDYPSPLDSFPDEHSCALVLDDFAAVAECVNRMNEEKDNPVRRELHELNSYDFRRIHPGDAVFNFGGAIGGITYLTRLSQRVCPKLQKHDQSPVLQNDPENEIPLTAVLSRTQILELLVPVLKLGQQGE